jgi:predicted small secreted protein
MPKQTKSKAVVIVSLVALLGAASLSACHTTAGAGEDISKTGQAIKHSADENTP